MPTRFGGSFDFAAKVMAEGRTAAASLGDRPSLFKLKRENYRSSGLSPEVTAKNRCKSWLRHTRPSAQQRGMRGWLDRLGGAGMGSKRGGYSYLGKWHDRQDLMTRGGPLQMLAWLRKEGSNL